MSWITSLALGKLEDGVAHSGSHGGRLALDVKEILYPRNLTSPKPGNPKRYIFYLLNPKPRNPNPRTLGVECLRRLNASQSCQGWGHMKFLLFVLGISHLYTNVCKPCLHSLQDIYVCTYIYIYILYVYIHM